MSWRWAFFINVAVAAAVLAVGPTVLVESRPGRRPRLDVPGAVTVTSRCWSIVYGLTQAGERSWGSVHSYGALLAGAVLVVVFWRRRAARAQPLVPVHVMARRTVGIGNLAGLLAFATETSVVFLLTLYLQKVLGLSPLAAGLSFAVLGVGTVIGGMVAPKVIAAFGSRNRSSTGFLVQGAATVPLVFLGADRAWIAVLLGATFAGGVANLRRHRRVHGHGDLRTGR